MRPGRPRKTPKRKKCQIHACHNLRKAGTVFCGKHFDLWVQIVGTSPEAWEREQAQS